MRIVIADDHTIVREGLKLMLDHQPGIEVIGTASDGQGAYDLVEELHPDIVLLDISMPPGESGVVTAGRIHSDWPDTKIIMITMYAEKEYLLYTVQIGVSGYVLKNAPEADIVDAIRTVQDGGVYVSKEMLPYLVQGFVNRNREEEDAYLRLTEREIEILTLIAKGYGNKEISEKLFISVKTVESYKSKIMNKLDVKSRPELVEYALKKKLVQY
ncbi:MAG: response regulator transcription factor [Lachnospiraceae bacterium]|nr:response regulator transcription factor [Clostridium sp. SY8519]MCI1654337.1 response regulator transcription factor [Lachnospiraceae bacterium]MCI1656699.1 response regulator transcription factor [Lachnospiraceae bacterium]MCI2195293.1 response regulator transcription factor [Lachnospiraceae bacterium]HAD20351.1 DNA-binding response regulator [Lachnospiraceae bacterium]